MRFFPKISHEYYLKEGQKIVATGATSFIYETEDNSEFVYGVTTDKYKIEWLELNKDRFKFKIIGSEPYINGGIIYRYKIIRLEEISDKDKKYMKEDIFNIIEKLYTNLDFVGIDETISISKFVYSKWFKDELELINKCFSKYDDELELDLHIKQVMKIGNTFCIVDPVFAR